MKTPGTTSSPWSPGSCRRCSITVGPVAVGLILLGLAKLVAAAAMWEGREWGGYLLAVTVAVLLPLDLRQAVVYPTASHLLLAAANVAVLVVLVLLLRGWLPGRPLGSRATHP